MEKEQKKLLLVAVSVGVFLLVTITVAMIVLTPKVQVPENTFYSSHPVQFGRSQPQANTDNNPIQPIFNNTQEINLNIDREIMDSAIAIDSNNGDSLTIQIPKPSTAAVPNTTETTAQTRTTASTAATAPAATTTPAATRPAATTQTTATTRSSTASSTATARPAATARAINDYWVQTGAFSAFVRAEDAREALASKGFTSIIENREIDGRVWYRVRLGPYTTEREANYWLALVKSIDGFGESQVRQTVRQQ